MERSLPNNAERYISLFCGLSSSIRLYFSSAFSNSYNFNASLASRNLSLSISEILLVVLMLKPQHSHIKTVSSFFFLTRGSPHIGHCSNSPESVFYIPRKKYQI